MNISTVSHSCARIFRQQAADLVRRSARCVALQPALVMGPRTAHCRNMSLWFMAKKRIQRAWSEQVKIESFDTIQKFGIEVGVSHVLVKMGARVQFTNEKWYTKQDIRQGSLPVDELRGHFVVAIDAKETDLDQFSMVDVVKLTEVKYLSLEGCDLVDDHCLASLVHLRDTLTHLNINDCEQVTENGVATLHKLRNLERLNMNDMPRVNFAPLVAVMLEDVLPRLRISLVTKQVDKYVEEARKGTRIIEEHRKQAGLDQPMQDDLSDLRNRIREGGNCDNGHVQHGFHKQDGEVLSKR